MANSIIDTNGFRFFLEFEGIGMDGIPYETAEWIGFDASVNTVEQAPKRYGRDVIHGGLDSVKFVDAVRYENNGIEQVINPQGQVSTYLDYGLAWLLYGYKKYNFEFKAYAYVTKNGVQGTKMQLDFSDKDTTDGYTYVKCKLIDKNAVMNVKRRFEDKFNIFSNKDVYQNVITPAPTVNVLRKAAPETNISTWKSSSSSVQALARISPSAIQPPLGDDITYIKRGCNNCNDLEDSQINDTLSFASQTYATNDIAIASDGNTYHIPNDSNSFTYVSERNDASNVRIEITDIDAESGSLINDFSGTEPLTGYGNARLMLLVGDIDLTLSPMDAYVLWQRDFTFSGDNSIQPIPTSFTLNIPSISRSKRIFIFFDCEADGVTFNNYDTPLASYRIFVNQRSMRVSITQTEIAIDTVLKAVRWVDYLKQSLKYNSNIPLNASLFDVNGKHYDNVVWNKKCVSQNTENFTSTIKQTLESVEEVNCDYELYDDECFIGHHTDFYKNYEIARFLIVPSSEQPIGSNDRTMINKFLYNYTYEQDRTSKGTNKAIHTETQWNILNDSAENSKEVKNKLIRDPLRHQAVVNIEISQPTTSISEDEEVFISNITSLAPNTKGGFPAFLLMRINEDGYLQILNMPSFGDNDSVVINWNVLGISVGGTFEITLGVNIGVYTIVEFTSTVITLNAIGFNPTVEGNRFIKVEYFYTDVDLVTVTDEGFILNPDKTQNAVYSIKRNMINCFGELLANALQYCKRDLFNGFFKANGNFTSQLTTELNPVTENAPIEYSSLPNPLITGAVYNLNLVAGFNEIIQMQANYRQNRGFIRCIDLANKRVLKLYPLKSKHQYSTNELTLLGEEKFDTEYVDISFSNGILTVNDVVYNLSGNLNWYIVEGIGMFTALDADQLPICEPTYFDRVRVKGVVYDTKSAFISALNSLV